MKRAISALGLVVAVWMFASGHVDATTTRSTHHQATCRRINAALQSGQSMKAVEKRFKVSSKRVHQCQQEKTASTAPHQRSSSQAH